MTLEKTLGGHRFWVGDAVEDLGADPGSLRDAYIEITSEGWRDRFDRYSSPFEAKWTWRDKFRLPPATNELLPRLELMGIDLAQAMFTLPGTLPNFRLVRDYARHYAGIFKYETGDHLGVHVDAGIFPGNTMYRKAVTALLYLGDSDGDLELWDGASCALEPVGPHLDCLAVSIPPRHGRVVIFENNDHAWHGAGRVTDHDPRVVLTCSFFTLAVNAFRNQRQRAYFVPRPGEQWDEATLALRDKRADPDRYAEAYRV